MSAALVALNAHLLAGAASYRSAGIHQYIANLVRQLPEVASDWHYTVFVGTEQPLPTAPRLQFQRSAWPTQHPLARILWEQCAQPWALWRARPALLHSLAFVSPLLNPFPSVVTVYDLSFTLPASHFAQRPAQRLYLTALTAHSCRRARRVIAISASTRHDLVTRFGLAPEKIDLAYPGLDAAFRPLPTAEVEAFRQRKGLPEKFILHVGTLEPRKNLANLIRAFAGLPPSLSLVLAGGRGWLYHELYALAQNLQLTERIRFPGFIPADELVYWYNAAAVFAYPSVYEGFGMPVIEALACGRPVVTSNVSSLPEAGGEAALLVTPDDVPELATALRRALQLSPAELARGPAHAARFTWRATAEQTVACYQQALSA